VLEAVLCELEREAHGELGWDVDRQHRAER